MQAGALRAALTRPWVHGEAADLRGLTVTEPLDLRGLTLAGFDFSGTTFAAPVLAERAQFEGLSWFTGCRFAEADFSGALFVNDARFDGAVFDSAPRFAGAEFRGIARFDGARMPGGDLSGLVCYGNAALARVAAAAPVDFRGGEFLGGLWAEGARFDQGADFAGAEVHGRLCLRDARAANAALDPAGFGMAFGIVMR